MRVLIDISDKDYEVIKKNRWSKNTLMYCIDNGIVIPDDATNENVFEILFPEIELRYVGNMIGAIEYEGKCIDIVVDDKWWRSRFIKDMRGKNV
jgi:hypothetical protein